MNNTPEINLSRRKFLIGSTAVGAGLMIGFDLSAIAGTMTDPGVPLSSPEIGVWVVIKPTDDVVIRVVKSEIGQGTITGLCQLVAEELDCNWQKVSFEYPTPGESLLRGNVWGSFLTGGSRGIRQSQQYVRKGGAAARMMLIQAAANQWGVATSECIAQNSVITHQPTGRSLTYGNVCEAAAKLPVPTDITLKTPQEWKIIGKPVDRIDDMVGKVTGRQIYGIDLMLPDMLTATIKACPVFGGKLKSFDASNAMQVQGVRKVVPITDDALVVIADTFWQAKTAMDLVTIEWDYGPNIKTSSATIKAKLIEGLSSKQAFTGNKSGNADAAFANAANTLESTFSFPFLCQAPMEPMNATARWTPDQCEAWVPTQNAQASLTEVIKASGLPAEKCDVYKINPGGGFGRRGAHQDFTTLAVLTAKQMPGIPVKLLWTREEDMTHSHYHPVMMGKLTGAFDRNKNLLGLRMRLSGQSILASISPAILAEDQGSDPNVFEGVDVDGQHALTYTYPSLFIDYAMRNTHVPPGNWRGVNVNQNGLFLESFMDELADYAGKDPLAFRLQFLDKKPRAAAVLNAVADAIGWNKSSTSGFSKGIAQMHSYGSYAAVACELSVNDEWEVKIHRIVAAIDPGYVVNPAQVERQTSGALMFGLTALFEGEITIDQGRVVQMSFNNYDSIRMSQMPPVETIIIQGGGDDWGGVGEPVIAVGSPAVLNAIYRATGKRFRNVPLKNSGVTLI